MDGHTFISYARDDAAVGLDLAAGLQARGIPVWLDLWNIQPGADWDQAIDRGLRACASFVILLSPSAVASSEVRGELRSALNGRKPMVPVLYRPCDIPRQLQTIEYLDFDGSDTVPDRLLDRLAAVLQQGSAPKSDGSGRTYPEDLQPPFESAGQHTRRGLRIRRDVLDDVQRETVDRLARSVQTRTPLAIAMERQPWQVIRPWDADVKIGHGETAPPPATILELFADPATDGRLLILGAPGSGKTTALLQLSGYLIARARSDLDAPIPVLLNLSSRTQDSLTLGDWLVRELKVKYGVRGDHATRWLDERSVVPLLDGLDELPPSRQEECVRAINQFQQVHRPAHLVVCCRLAEYENLANKLQVMEAVQLLPLSDGQVREYLASTGCPQLWESIREDPASAELAHSPLMLGLMASIRDGDAFPQGASVAEPARRSAQLFDSYIHRLMQRAVPRGGYSQTQTTRWLAGLATMLAQRGQSELLLERMQPDWLSSTAQLWLYRAGVAGLTCAVVMAAGALLDRLTDLLPRGVMGRELWNKAVVMGAVPSESAALLIVGLITGLVVATRSTITPIETLTWSWRNARSGARVWFAKCARAGLEYGTYAGAAIGALMGLMFTVAKVLGRAPVEQSASAWRTGLLVGTAASLAVSLALVHAARHCWVRGPLRPAVALRTRAAVISAVVYGAVLGLTIWWPAGIIAALGIAMLVAFSPLLNPASCVRLVNALIVGLVSGLTFGVATAWLSPFSRDFATWTRTWAGTGLNVGIAAGILAGITAGWRGSATVAQPPEMATGPPLRRAAGRSIAVGIGVGIALSVVAGVIAWSGHESLIRGFALAGLGLQLAFVFVLTATVAVGLCGGVNAGLIVGMFGALCGTMSGLTGPDVQRRTVPNQGIRQSAINVAVFAALGCLFIGVPFGLLNVLASAGMARTLPDAADWLRTGVGSGLFFGVLAGLLPGAACLQHVTLRFVLWWSGKAPMRYARFLDFATERMLLQRIGGRYRFLHALLRDHFARAVLSSGPGLAGDRS